MRHYNEAQVGEALSPFYSDFRNELFLQTKFTPITGHDSGEAPYKADDKLSNQVFQSYENSIKNLKTPILDSYVLHSPYGKLEDNYEVWNAICLLKKEGKVRYIGISNIYVMQLLKEIIGESKQKPNFIQNRFYNDTWYDEALRRYLKENDIVYQSFWTLSANPFVLFLIQRLLESKKWQVAMRGRTKEMIWYFYLSYYLGIVPIIGTTKIEHMKEDVAILSELSPPIPEFYYDLIGMLKKFNPSLLPFIKGGVEQNK